MIIRLGEASGVHPALQTANTPVRSAKALNGHKSDYGMGSIVYSQDKSYINSHS